MPFVLDASIAPCWGFDDEDHPIAAQALERIRTDEGRMPRTHDEAVVLALTRRHRLTVYDAAYLELAQRDEIPLATLDTDLASAARAEGVTLIGAT